MTAAMNPSSKKLLSQTRPWNFSAGPAALPTSVLEQAAAEMLDWQGTGMSVMEMSHRGAAFSDIYAKTESDLRELLLIPDDYAVLFLQGGGQGENAIVPLNLMGRQQPTTNPTFDRAAFVNTGHWSKRTIEEFARYGQAHVAADASQTRQVAGSQHGAYQYIPDPQDWDLPEDCAYLHICSNETIGGVEYSNTELISAMMNVVKASGVDLVADMSSNILSRPLRIQDYGLIYAGAQKNIGPAGVTIVIIRRDLLGRALPSCPSVFNYTLQAQQGSMFNTPPTYSIYIAGLVFQWLKEQGGVPEMAKRNAHKAKIFYDFLDTSALFFNPVCPRDRSWMNIPFYLRDESLNDLFLAETKAAGLLQLKGHKAVGGMRASLYNAIPVEAVDALIAFMRDFEQRAGVPVRG